MTVGIKEFLNFLKVHFPSEADGAAEKRQAGKTKQTEDQAVKQGEKQAEKTEQTEKPHQTEDKPNGEQAEPEGKGGRMEKQLNDEIEKEKMEYNRFAPLRNIVKNFTFIKFNNIKEKNPSDIVQQIFMLAHNKKEKYILRHLCKIIPLDCICKPHMSPFIKTILPVLKKNFPKGTCAQESFTVGHLSKLMSVAAEEGDKEGEKEEGQAKEGEKEEEQAKEGDKKEEQAEEEQAKEGEKKEDQTKEDQKVEEKKAEESQAKEETTPSEDKHAAGKKVSWALVYKCSNTKTLMKRDVLTVLDNCIGSNYSVNLGNPDMAVVVYVTEVRFAFLREEESGGDVLSFLLLKLPPTSPQIL
ncbi:hypothetical protein PCYB_147350 [Plasmodium cynomolgi strain B]|uniref:THUMP domain-containing protein n=1 Tax=Plasmodium cynomolgi (strain B) TaxID=1120755 RepID=K6VIU0_PLACD|nr:hypothetical protein PCYB_147350 [Plasmodium cynomolgi strain B]GAB69307.1 hypothetical protein PCYB_147350 [Plasmodium cynomolgi strain B]